MSGRDKGRKASLAVQRNIRHSRRVLIDIKHKVIEVVLRFVEAKPHPNDIDGYFECDVMDIARNTLPPKLNALDPHKVWTWDPKTRRKAHGFTKKQLPMWHRYRVELYPHYKGFMSGITDPWGNELQFPAAFRQQRGTGHRKGIIQVVPGDHR